MLKTKRFLELTTLSIVLLSPFSASAKIGLIAYEAMMMDPWLTSAGHAGVYLSDVCPTGDYNQFRLCDDTDRANGITGVVIQRYSDLAGRDKKEMKAHIAKGEPGNNDWIAMPINENLYGTDSKGSAPILMSPKVLDNLRDNAYNDPTLFIKNFTDPVSSDTPKELAAAKKQQSKDGLDHPLAKGDWQWPIGSTALRGSRMLSLETPEHGAENAIAFLNKPENNISHFNAQFNNCANFANNMFRVEFGKDSNGKQIFNGRGMMEDAFLVTPSSDEKGVKAVAKKENIPYVITTFNQTPGTYAPSAHNTELTTESNTNLAFGQIVSHLVPFPGSYVYSALKFARKLGMPLPGYRNYMDVSGKETKQHGSDELAQVSFQLDQAKKDKDQTLVQSLKTKRQSLQNETFGTKACWAQKRNDLKAILQQAFQGGILNGKYAKEFRMRQKMNQMMRMIPVLHLNPTHAKLIADIFSPDTSVEKNSDGLVLNKDGATAGLTRDNIDNYDAKLGFLVMSASVVYQLDSSQTLIASDFDADWKSLLSLSQKNGLSLTASMAEPVQSCSGKADPSVEEPVATPAAETIGMGDAIVPSTSNDPGPEASVN